MPVVATHTILSNYHCDLDCTILSCVNQSVIPYAPECVFQEQVCLAMHHLCVMQALDGFMLVISSDGRILYTSESISTYLGLRQVRKKCYTKLYAMHVCMLCMCVFLMKGVQLLNSWDSTQNCLFERSLSM